MLNISYYQPLSIKTPAYKVQSSNIKETNIKPNAKTNDLQALSYSSLYFLGSKKSKMTQIADKVRVLDNIRIPGCVENYCKDYKFDVLGTVNLKVTGQENFEKCFIISKGTDAFMKYAIDSSSQSPRAQTCCIQILDSQGKLIVSSLLSLCTDKNNKYGIPNFDYKNDYLLYGFNIINYGAQSEDFINQNTEWLPERIPLSNYSKKKMPYASKAMYNILSVLDLSPVCVAPSLESTLRFHKRVLGAKECPVESNDLFTNVYIDRRECDKCFDDFITSNITFNKSVLKRFINENASIKVLKEQDATDKSVLESPMESWYF